MIGSNKEPWYLERFLKKKQESLSLPGPFALPPLIAGQAEFEKMLLRGATPGADYNVDDGDSHDESTALGYFNGSKITNGECLDLGEKLRGHLQLTDEDKVCVSVTLYHAFGIGTAVAGAFQAGAAVVLPAVGGLQGCGVPSQRAEVTMQVMLNERCSILIADTHTIKALDELGATTKLPDLRGGVCKVGPGSDFLDVKVLWNGVVLSTLGKK